MRTSHRILAAIFIGGGLLFATIYARQQPMPESNKPEPTPQTDAVEPAGPAATEVATFGAGCFWCTEGVFLQLKGVQSVVSGYTGGQVPNPTYEQICTGRTGHAEVVQITFDPSVVTFADLLKVFWQTHDPTTLNRQGNDTGTQYRSAIFYHSPEQQQQAEAYKKQLDESGAFANPIVTEIVAAQEFFPAEDYHQNYYDLNEQQPYCQFVIRPKIEKLKKEFQDKLKTN
ncbi:Peptide methionine sulfoxide reductase MsrA [Symmachiella dynata]|uniref:Peptide methionine sulfoxide reductase MsrA n=1 Tax=Symmachiella dynata TaxID=2527995 RepID=A0A517ZGM2_9PLAN|nr:peptide-methionine (S)-S-oxide reductase MsrA [Symmachiella dynata]QDU41601.1 Peptide methionine sulfoxide reductase MsrA [Symmachiella dynata]